MALAERPYGDSLVSRGAPVEVATSTVYELVKRTLDLLVALPALVITLPLMLLIAIIIRLDSRGPIVFRQERVARGGGGFRFYKFRTMQVDARDRYPHLYEYRYDEQTIATMRFKLLEDPRLTRVGRYLRKTSLDELPNLINVVLGDVSLIGPRPEIPEMLPYYKPWQLAKFSVKPGVTGLAQVSGRGLLTFQDTIAADLKYVSGCGLWLDLRILLWTLFEIVRRQGAF
ncbi:MAG TPA: sugar transferase [Candidatus Acidoferrales bacterium]|nr:sugar transferase [Candidatus Acidoferrales bacterium]